MSNRSCAFVHPLNRARAETALATQMAVELTRPPDGIVAWEAAMGRIDKAELAISGGKPIRTKPLPPEWPGAPFMDEREVEAVTRVVRSRSLFRYYGPDLQKETVQFEAEFAEFIGVKHALAVTSGTGALHTAMGALGVGPGQEVIIPAHLWVSVIGAVVNVGAIPVVADIDKTFCLDPAAVESKITEKTRGIILVHMNGAPGNVQAIQDIARKRNLWLLEDCAQCAGGSIGGKKAGSWGDMAIYSFQLNKNMTAGDGGCVVTDDDRLYRRAFATHDVGYVRNEAGRLVFDDPDLRLWGRGYRMDELRAAVLRVQLQKLPAITGAMKRSKARIREALKSYPEVTLRKLQDPEGDTGAFLLAIFSDPTIADDVTKAMQAEGISSCHLISDPYHWGLHLYYENASLVTRSSADPSGFPWSLSESSKPDYSRGACPVADDLFARTMYLPIPSNLTDEDESDIIRAFEKVLGAGLGVRG